MWQNSVWYFVFLLPGGLLMITGWLITEPEDRWTNEVNNLLLVGLAMFGIGLVALDIIN